MSSQIIPSDSYIRFLAPPASKLVPNHIKDILPDYRITEGLGSGGFADVYAGIDTSGKYVAIKIPQMKFDKTIDGSIYDKFQKEASVWSKLEHRNIVGFHSAGDQPLPHIVMEMMDRDSLRTLMKKHRLTVGEAVYIMLQVLEGLSYAHHMAIVHRDLKPENILFTKDGTPKITDWGIGKFLAATRMTETVGIKGTLNYCAPEQFDNRKYGKVDWKTDIFQIGVLFYEMLTGMNPFAGEDLPEVYRKVVSHEPDPPSTLNPVVPKELDNIVMGALIKQKKRRWQTDAMLHELKRFFQKLIPEKGLQQQLMQQYQQFLQQQASQQQYSVLSQYQRQQQQSQGKAPKHKKKKKRLTKQQKRIALGKKIMMTTIILLVLIIGSIGGYLWYNWDKDGDEDRDNDKDGIRDRDDAFPDNPEEWADSDGDGVGDNSDIAPNYASIQKFSDLNFIWATIGSGTFTMGSPEGEENEDEHPQHQVTISKGFQMLKYEVTQAQWEAVMGSNPSYFSGDNNPVEEVSWNDCQSFISRLNELDSDYTYRLPTEAEWEYCCRAGSDAKYCFGDDEGQLDQYAWHGYNSNDKTHPVGEKKPNAWGLYDMHGNVWEWCQDWYDSDYYEYSPNIDPQGPISGSFRVNRGGSFFVFTWLCESAFRGEFTAHLSGYGLRLVRSSN